MELEKYARSFPALASAVMYAFLRTSPSHGFWTDFHIPSLRPLQSTLILFLGPPASVGISGHY